MSSIDSSAGENESAEKPESSVLEENLKSRATWVRAIYMVVFCFLFAIVEVVLVATVVIQFVWRLAKGQPNQHLLELLHDDSMDGVMTGGDLVENPLALCVGK